MRKGTCKHFNSEYHNECCAAGVRYEDVTTEPNRLEGKGLRLPCHQICTFKAPSQIAEFEKRGQCPKYEEPTAQEIAKDRAELDAVIARMEKTCVVIGKVKKLHKGKDWKGVEVCPVCGGNLHMTHAALNGHVWGKCETEGCVAWME